jgi:hypothetical protein
MYFGFQATMISQYDPESSNGKVSAGTVHLTLCKFPNMIKVVLHYA